MRRIIVTGSEGLIGKQLVSFLKKNSKIYKLDLILGDELTDETFVKKWFKKNHADYLVNCFALNDHVDSKRKKTTLYNISLESFSKYLNVNLTALFSVCREFARNNKKGSIINFSSNLGIDSAKPFLYKGSHKHIAYGISKAGVINLTKYLAIHLAPNIRVNSIAPGGMFHKQDKEFVKEYSKLTPMGRMLKKNELNGIVDFLCSEKSSYMTGSTINVDGGSTAW